MSWRWGWLGVVALTAGCGSARGATLAQLQQRAQIDTGCPGAYLRHWRLDDRTELVQGCGRQLVYVESCERIRGKHSCTWMLDSPWVFAPQVVVATPDVDRKTTIVSRPPTPRPRSEGVGTLNVASEGGFCDVTVNGKPQGVTPVGGIWVPRGVSRVTCDAGGRSLTYEIEIQPGERSRISFDLERGTAREAPHVKDWGF